MSVYWEAVPLRSLISQASMRNRPDLPLLSVVRDKGIIKRNLDKSDNHNVIPEDLSNYKVVSKGQFVINKMKAWQGSCGVSQFKGIVSPAYFVFDLDIHNPRFFNYSIRSRTFVDEFNRISKGIRVDQWDLELHLLKYIRFPLPSSDEQDQIVRYLDWKVSQINRFINAKRLEILLLEEQKRATVIKAAWRGLNNDVSMKNSGLEWLGYVPDHWEIRSLFGLATEQEISNNDTFNQNLLSLSYGKIVNKDINTTDGLLPTTFDNYQIVNDGNIILRFTDLQNDHKSLRVGLATQTGIITSAYTCLKVRDGISPLYVYYLLHSYDLCKVFYGMGGGVRQGIGYKDIRKMLMLLPPYEEQISIAKYLNEQDSTTNEAIEKLNQEITLLTEYRTRLISDVVTGKMDVSGVVVSEYNGIIEVDNRNVAENETAILSERNDVEIDYKTVELATEATKVNGHNQQFDDAVMIAGIVNAFYDENYPLGRKKVQKLLYILRRYQKQSTIVFKKKAAGPYADEVRYRGGEPIAIKNMYIITTTVKNKGTSFAKGDKITQALDYIEKWGFAPDIQWLIDNFRYTKVDDLELYATVDMAICDLVETDTSVSVSSIRNLIATNKEWSPKLNRQTFSDHMISKAIDDLKILFGDD